MAINFADSNLGRIAYERETTFGELNSPFTGQIARITSSGLAANKETAVSDELRSDRMVSDLIEGGYTSGGDIGFEMSLGGTWDDFLESLLCGTWTTPTAFTGDLTVTAATQTIADAGAGGTMTANLAVGDFIFIAGMTNAGNNGWHRVATVVNTDSVTVETAVIDLTDETSATGTVTMRSSTLVNPGQASDIVKRSYNLEQFFSDVNISQLFLGQRLGTMTLSTSAPIVSGTWTFSGLGVQAQEGAEYVTSTVPAACTEVVGATANVGVIKQNGTAATCLVQSIDLTVENNLRPQVAVGSKYPCGIGYGRQVITGTMNLYFQNLANYTAFLQHTDATLEWSYTDNAGNQLLFFLPRIKLATDTPSLDGVDTDVMESIDFQALAYDEDCTDPATLPYQIQITAANNP